MKKIKMLSLLAATVLVALSFSSCKKEPKEPAPTEPSVEVTFNSVTIPVANVTFTPNVLCDRYYVMSVSKEVWNTMIIAEDTYEAKLDALIEYEWMAIEHTEAATEIFELNGYADYENLMLVLVYDSEDNAFYQEVEFSSPSIDTSLPLPEKVGVSAVIDGTSATFTFTPGANTVGYYYTVYSKDNYDELYADGGEESVREYTAFYGDTAFGATEDTWNNLTYGITYVVFVAPFNANGADHTYGYGPMTLYEFTIEAPEGAPQKTNGAVSSVRTNNVRHSELLGIRK